jgi:uncharacterized membrane protein YoaK (UPF0700 family)
LIYTLLEVAGFVCGVILLEFYSTDFQASAPRVFDLPAVAIVSAIFAILALSRSAFLKNDGIRVLSLLVTVLSVSFLFVAGVLVLALLLRGPESNQLDPFAAAIARLFVILSASGFFAALAFKSLGKLIIPSPIR